MPMLAFLLAFSCWLYYAQPAGPCIAIFNEINGHRIFFNVQLNWYDRIG